MKKVILSILFLFSILCAYLLLYPVPIHPANWQPAPIPKYEGQYAANTLLKNIKHEFDGQCLECEDIAIDSAGMVYGGSVNGDIIQFNRQTKERKVIANTGGRPLGLEMDRTNNILVADAHKGLLSVSQSGAITVLSTEHNGLPFKFTDDLEVAANGTIYFSDASHKFGIHDYKLDIFEHRPNGRLLAYHPQTKQTTLLLDDLYFANGIAISHDSSFVLVNETGKYRVTRYWLSGGREGTSDIFIDNLPGFPDGISRGDDGIFWLTLISPRTEQLDNLLNNTFMRKVVARLPAAMMPKPQRYGFILGLDKNGQIIHNFQDPDGGFFQAASVQQFKNELFFGSLAEDAVGVMALPD